MKTDGTAGIRESGGPTILDVMAIADGQTVIRSGTTLIGGTVVPVAPLVYADGSVPAGNTVANTTTETAFASTYTIPANRLKVNSVIRVKLYGTYGTTIISPTLTGKFKVGGTTVLNTGALTAVANLTNVGWWAEAILIVTSIGVTGTIEAQGFAEFASAATTGLSVNLTNTATYTKDTTGTLALTITVQWSAASAANTITLRPITVEILDV